MWKYGNESKSLKSVNHVITVGVSSTSAWTMLYNLFWPELGCNMGKTIKHKQLHTHAHTHTHTHTQLEDFIYTSFVKWYKSCSWCVINCNSASVYLHEKPSTTLQHVFSWGYQPWSSSPNLLTISRLCFSLTSPIPPSGPPRLAHVKSKRPTKDSGPPMISQNSSMPFAGKRMPENWQQTSPILWELLPSRWLPRLRRTCGPSYRKWGWRTQSAASWSMPSIWARTVSSCSSTSRDPPTTQG